MLIEFTVENYRSFKGPVTLSMEATHLVGRDPAVDAATTFEAPNGMRLLRSAVIYGANASGKSNVIKGMRDFIATVQRSAEALDAPLPVEPFRLDEETAGAPTRMEVRVLVDGVEHRYGFRATATAVEEEWLYRRAKKREALLFHRIGADVRLGAGFSEGAGLATRTRTNALFLTVAAAFNGDISSGVRRVIFGRGATLLEAHHEGGTERLLHNLSGWRASTAADDPRGRAFMTALLRDADTGIVDVEIENGPPNAEVLDAHEGITVWAIHRGRGPDGSASKRIAFELDTMESAGTRRIFRLGGFLSVVLEFDAILFVDELDARLHPALTRKLIELFHSAETNPHNAQLVFTTHDTNLLTSELFRRDQVWFTEKGSDGASDLYSLAEVKGVREDAAWEKAYLAGRFGAVPLLNRFGEGLRVRGPE